MIGWGFIVWGLLVVLAVLNGGFRDTSLSPLVGDTAGRAIGSLMLPGLILPATLVTIGWIGPRTAGRAHAVGAIWLGLTVAFEVGAGHYAFGK